jgi:lysophospholipase L1-like esterase
MAHGKRGRATKTPAPSGPATVLPFPTAGPPTEPGKAVSVRRRVLYFSIPFVLFFAVLASIEIAVRAQRPHVSTLEAFVLAPEQQRGFRDLHDVNVFEGDPLLFWRLAPNLSGVVWDFTPVATNRQGLRYPTPVGRKPTGTFRIACFGDSITFGYRVPTVWPERPQDYDHGALPFPALLEAGLRAANPGRAIEVIPLAVPGYSSHQGLAWLRRDIGWLDPDLVVVNYGWNDINTRARTDRETMSTSRTQVFFRRLMTASQALIHASRWWQGRGSRAPATAAGTAATRVLAHEYVENISAMARTAARRGAHVIVLGPVYRDPVTEPGEAQRIAEHRQKLREAMTAAKIAYLEIPELHETGWPGNEPLFGERIHPGFRGHRLMANLLADRMAREGMLSGLRPPAPLPVQ